MEAALQSGIRVAEQISSRDGVLRRKRRAWSRTARSKTKSSTAANCCDADSVLTVQEGDIVTPSFSVLNLVCFTGVVTYL
jgi:hypothetical protein